VDVFECVEDRLTPESLVCRLAEAYVEGRLEIYMHFRSSTVAGGIAGYWCAAIKVSKERPDLLMADVVRDKVRQGFEVI